MCTQLVSILHEDARDAGPAAREACVEKYCGDQQRVAKKLEPGGH